MEIIENIIQGEVDYFRPMLERAQRSSEVERLQWRSETIRQRQERISLEVHRLCNGTVLYGPFKGLKIEPNTYWGRLDLGSQCLGLYEKEFLDFLAGIKNKEFSTFIDIGAADGYYAVGMLVSGKVRSVVCFEQSEDGRQTIKRNWESNGTPGHLKVLGEATFDSIEALTAEDLRNALVMIDIEGAEFELLNYDVLNKLSDCTLLIEIHNWIDDFNNKYAYLLRRLYKHFEISIIERVDRLTVNIAELRDFTDDNRLLLTSERRPCLMRFLRLTPKDKIVDFPFLATG